MEAWEPISEVELSELLQHQLAECPPAVAAIFEAHRVPPYRAPIRRNDRLESVFIVAQRGPEVMYFEDVEEGFNFSPLSDAGEILEHWCNQDELKYALRRWQ
jgi:hypothetical protein